MILDLQHFLRLERPLWDELEAWLRRLEENPDLRLTLEESRRFHYLYDRTASDLLRLGTFAASPEFAAYLEALVARAYGEIHETRDGRRRFRFLNWLQEDFPRTFRRRIRAFGLSVALTLLGAIFGAGILRVDPDAKEVLLPFSHLMGKPSERVSQEEKSRGRELTGVKATFAGSLMTHNIRVSMLTLAMGMTYGLGTAVLLFYNGVILGAVSYDYVQDGQTRFLLGWLLPHGSVEIPSVLIAGQAGFILAGALLGSRRRLGLRERLAAVRPDLVTLIGGFCLLLIWAGTVEAFFFTVPRARPALRREDRLRPVGARRPFFLSRLFGTQRRAAGGAIAMTLHLPGRKTLCVQTPEGVVFNLRVAGLFTRFLALAIDLGVITAASTLLSVVTSLVSIVSPDFAKALFIVSYFVLSIGYGIFTEWNWRGQSLGKRLMRLRVVDASGLKLQLTQIIIRNLLRPIDLLPLAYLLGGAISFWSQRGQRLGDLAANTAVIYIPESFALDTQQLQESKYNSFREYPHLEARLRQRVAPAEAALALDAILRRDELDPQARVELFRDFAAYFRGLVPFEEHVDEAITDEQFVRNAVASLYRQKAAAPKTEAVLRP